MRTLTQPVKLSPDGSLGQCTREGFPVGSRVPEPDRGPPGANWNHYWAVFLSCTVPSHTHVSLTAQELQEGDSGHRAHERLLPSWEYAVCSRVHRTVTEMSQDWDRPQGTQELRVVREARTDLSRHQPRALWKALDTAGCAPASLIGMPDT